MRLKPEIEWYEKKALSNIYLFHLCQVFIIIVGGTIPIINIFGFAGSTTDPGILIWSSVLLVTVTTLTGFLQLTEAHEVWILYRSTSESLRREYHLFSLDADGYTDEKDPYDKNKLFIERVELESILAGVAGGEFDQKQIDWLKEELANAPKDEAVIICVHHPAFSLDIHHSGSSPILNTLDTSFQELGRIADIVPTAHVHNYQRFTRRLGDQQVPYIVAGAGGYWNLHHMQTDLDGNQIEVPFKIPCRKDVDLENYCDNHYGYLLM